MMNAAHEFTLVATKRRSESDRAVRLRIGLTAACVLFAGLSLLLGRYRDANVGGARVEVRRTVAVEARPVQGQADLRAPNPAFLGRRADVIELPIGPTPALAPSSIVASLGIEPISHALNRLGALARRGDAKAAYDAYELAEFCAVSDQIRIAQLELPIGSAAEVTAMFASEGRGRAQKCLGTTPVQIDERFANIRVAADGAIAGAAVKLLEAGAPPQPMPSDPNNSVVKEWTELALALVRRDAMSGDTDALMALAAVYQSNDLIPADPVQALIYLLATAEIRRAQQDASQPELELEQEFIAQTDQMVSADARIAARRAAIDLVAQCCSMSPF